MRNPFAPPQNLFNRLGATPTPNLNGQFSGYNLTTMHSLRRTIYVDRKNINKRRLTKRKLTKLADGESGSCTGTRRPYVCVSRQIWTGRVLIGRGGGSGRRVSGSSGIGASTGTGSGARAGRGGGFRRRRWGRDGFANIAVLFIKRRRASDRDASRMSRTVVRDSYGYLLFFFFSFSVGHVIECLTEIFGRDGQLIVCCRGSRFYEAEGVYWTPENVICVCS